MKEGPNNQDDLKQNEFPEGGNNGVLPHSLPHCCRNHAIFTIGPCLFLFGGSQPDRSPGPCYKYANGVWEPLPEPPIGMPSFRCARLSDELILFLTPHVALAFLLSTLRWRILAVFEHGATPPRFAWLWGTLTTLSHWSGQPEGAPAIAFGGFFQRPTNCLTFVALDSGTGGDDLRIIHSGPKRPSTSQVPAPRWFHCAEAVGKWFFIHGGRERRDVFSDTWMYDVTAHYWRQLAPTGPRMCPRAGHTFIRIGTAYDTALRFLVSGGWDGTRDSSGEEIGALDDLVELRVDPFLHTYCEATLPCNLRIGKDCHSGIIDNRGDPVFVVSGGTDAAFAYTSDVQALPLAEMNFLPASLAELTVSFVVKNLHDFAAELPTHPLPHTLFNLVAARIALASGQPGIHFRPEVGQYVIQLLARANPELDRYLLPLDGAPLCVSWETL